MNNRHHDPDAPMVYQIRLKGQVGSQWTDWFGGATITLEANGETLLTCSVVDQAALHGLLRKVRDVGIPLLSVIGIESGHATLRHAHSIAHERSTPMEATVSTLGTMKLANRTGARSPIVMARSAGVLYLLIAVLSGFVHFYVPGKLIVPGDAATTSTNILAYQGLFRVNIAVELVILLSEVVLSILLYVLFKPVSMTLALVATVSRLAMTTIHGVNVLNNVFVLLLLSGSAYVNVFAPNQVHALVTLFLDAYSHGFNIGVVFLALHAALLSYLIFRSAYVPRVLGVLFMIAAFGYGIDSFALVLLANHKTGAVYFALPIAIAEIAFPLWLLFKGVDVEQWNKRALASA